MPTQRSMELGLGSSPLARGAPEVLPKPALHERIIPARAGSTPTSMIWSRNTPDHPRSRGEHGVGGVEVVGDFGSSPLARGALAGFFPQGP